MQVRIIEYKASPFLPVSHVRAYPDAAGLLLLRHDESQVVAKHAGIRAPVLGYVYRMRCALRFAALTTSFTDMRRFMRALLSLFTTCYLGRARLSGLT